MTVFPQVCFSDESTFQILTEKSNFVRRRTSERYDPACITPTVKHPLSVMVWSVISAKGPGRLYVVEGMMNAAQYLKVLQGRLLPQMKEWFCEGENPVFMHDSAPCHKAKVVTKFLAEENVGVLDWPGNSPDMNPIENVWKVLKDEVSKFGPTTKRKLIEALIAAWNHNPKIKIAISNSINSMPRRIEALLKAKGHQTKY